MPLNIIVRGGKKRTLTMAEIDERGMRPGGIIYEEGNARFHNIQKRMHRVAKQTERLEPVKNPDMQLASVVDIKTFVDQHIATDGELTRHGNWQKFISDKPETHPWKRRQVKK